MESPPLLVADQQTNNIVNRHTVLIFQTHLYLFHKIKRCCIYIRTVLEKVSIFPVLDYYEYTPASDGKNAV